jgi:hypothetical protein
MPRPKYTVLEKQDAMMVMDRSKDLILSLLPLLSVLLQLNMLASLLALFPSLLAAVRLYTRNKKKLTDKFRRADGLVSPRLTGWKSLPPELREDVTLKPWCRFKMEHLKEIWSELERDLPASGKLRWPLEGRSYHVYGAFESFLLTLHRHAHPETFRENVHTFGMVEERQSEAVLAFLSHIHSTYGHSLKDMKRWAFLSEQSQDAYLARGFPMPHCFGNIDGKLYRTGRAIDPVIEDATFNFHHHAHGLVYLAIIAACGIHIGFFGPGPGGRNDGQHYNHFNVYDQLQALSDATNALLGTNSLWYTFSDGAFPASDHLMKGFINPAPGGPQAHFNHVANAGGRVTVEHGFHCQVSQFPFIDTFRKMKVSQQAYKLIYESTAIFHNIHVSAYGNQVGAGMHVAPPTLQKLFEVMRQPV